MGGKKKMNKIICLLCKKEVVLKKAFKQKFCCQKCRNKYYYDTHPEVYKKLSQKRKNKLYGSPVIRSHFLNFYVIPIIKKKFGEKCAICSSKDRLEVHHTDYEHPTIYNMFLLCKKCHEGVHHSCLKVF